MRKALYSTVLLTFLLQSFSSVAQSLGGPPSASVTADMPNVTPPSPSVAAFMKFEEVPVNNYTGIPDISVPLYSIKTLSSDVSVDLSLKYHPSSIVVKETAAYTGLGWSLFAGGSISRTVKGLPDEMLRYGNYSGNFLTRVGIYNDAIGNFANKYYETLNLIGTTLSSSERETIREFLWGAFEKGIYDSEHDLYQVNFMGYNARFYIKKNMQTGDLEVVRLDNDSSIKVEFNYTEINEHEEKYVFHGFTVYDAKGYKYLFTIKEMTSEFSTTGTQSFKPGTVMSFNYVDPISYVSSFHLSEIYDNNNIKIVAMNYEPITEILTDNTQSYNYIIPNILQGQLQHMLADPYNAPVISGILPHLSTTTKTRTITTQKLKKIDVINKAKITFVNETGRLDSNINNGAAKLKSITIDNWYDEQIKKYEFEYGYAHINTISGNNDLKRLLLTGVKEVSSNNKTLEHSFLYQNKDVNTLYLKEDYWGYFKLSGPGKETDPLFCATGVLRQIGLPTGGNIVFDFESNTYSYIGEDEVTDFTNNPDNGGYQEDIIDIHIPIDSGSHQQDLTLAPIDRNVYFTTESDSGGSFRLASKIDGNFQLLDTPGMQAENDGSGATHNILLEANKQYQLIYTRVDSSSAATARVRMFTKILPVGGSNQNRYLYGGGLRIRKISYFDTDDLTTVPPEKEKHYNYDFFGKEGNSSGSLVFAKPLFEYTQSRNVFSPTLALDNLTYKTYTSFNNLLALRTKGSDVGYKNVTVWEVGNGKSEFTYTSPIDFPENYYPNYYATVTAPFLPSPNFDYRRGLLINEKNYKQNGNAYSILSEKIYDYPIGDMDEQLVQVGLRAYNPLSCPMASTYNTYADFIHCINWSACAGANGFLLICSNVDSYLSNYPIMEAYGWPKLKTRINKDYFYPNGSSVPNIVTTTETYEYNPLNKMCSKYTVTNSKGEVLRTDYFFDGQSAGRNRIGQIKKIQTYRNSLLTSTKQINYSNAAWGSSNSSYLPHSVTISKGQNTLESRLKFIRYDQFSNPVEASLEDGTPVIYIWGYNNSQLVAMIENKTYSSISPGLINQVIAASDSNNETSLLIELENLRTSLPEAMVTSYVYKPLVGISVMIDPKGIKTYYKYDEFNRLSETRDNNNNLLSENKYRYRTQIN